ncbi:MAG: hypothetical protein IPK76_19310 [Lewinellaceae bacterium]|nr:hypothetical protein [Lewinellaceae bacterium]
MAKIYVSVYGTENKREVILELERQPPRLHRPWLQVGKQMRRVPNSIFLDDTIDEMYRVDALLSRVNEEDKIWEIIDIIVIVVIIVIRHSSLSSLGQMTNDVMTNGDNDE